MIGYLKISLISVFLQMGKVYMRSAYIGWKLYSIAILANQLEGGVAF